MKTFVSTFLVSVFLFLLLVTQSVFAKGVPFTGEVIAVTDGDTIKVLHDGASETIRLSGIDCPEKRQAFGNSARKITAELCFARQVTVLPATHDRYGRTVARVVLPDGSDLSRELVRQGYAWWYRKYAPDDDTLRQLELSARDRQTGLWSDPFPVAPWDFRHQDSKSRRQVSQ
jgi:micrococcal nuclease